MGELAPSWVSVKDRLPDMGVRCLVLCTSGWMQVMWRMESIAHVVNGQKIKTMYWYPGGIPVENTTHWMSLPEKP